MDNALYVGLSRQMTLRRELDVVANNIANADTAGFKVESLMPRTEPAPPPAPDGGRNADQLRAGRRRGPRLRPGRAEARPATPLRPGHRGRGLLQGRRPRSGERYTRDGRFTLDAQGRLVTQAATRCWTPAAARSPLDPTKGAPVDRRRRHDQPGRRARSARSASSASPTWRALSKDGDNLYRNTSNLPPRPPPDAPASARACWRAPTSSRSLEITRLIEVSRAYETHRHDDGPDRRPVEPLDRAAGPRATKELDRCRALRTAATGMAAQQLNVEVISNNIANMNTVGFKRQRAEFQDLLYQDLERAGVAVVRPGHHRADRRADRRRREGRLGLPHHRAGLADPAPATSSTWPSRAAAIFQVLMPSGETAYTRAGNLSVNDQGQLVTEDGYLIQPADHASRSDATDVVDLQARPGAGDHAGPDRAADRRPAASWPPSSTRRAWRPSATTCSWRAAPPARPPPATPGSTGFGTLLQGYTEASNVDAVTEITALIVAQRAYEMNSKVITTADQMLAATAR